MTPLSKSLIAVLGTGALVAATLALRSHPQPAPRPQLTPSQLAEMSPPPPAKPEPPQVSRPVNDPADLPAPPEEEPEIEDGNGS